MAAGDHDEVVTASQATALRVGCGDNNPAVICKSHRLHCGVERDVGQQAEGAGVGFEILQHLRMVGVIWRICVEWKVGKTVVVLADVDMGERCHAVPLVVVAPQAANAVAAFESVNFKIILLRCLDCS